MDGNTNKVKAIETRYNGYLFRSRLEARWAVFFDAMGIQYEYEKEGYELPSGWYLPDFWLSGINTWLEIKGKSPTKKEFQLCKELGDGTDAPVCIFHGLPMSNAGKIYSGSLHRSGGATVDFEPLAWRVFKGVPSLQLFHPLREGDLEEYKIMSPSCVTGPWERIVFGSEVRISGYEEYEDEEGVRFYSNKYYYYPVSSAEDAAILADAINKAKSIRFERG